MNSNYNILAVFEYSTEAHVTKSKLDSEGIQTILMDEKTVDSDPLISNAIGGVKLLVHKKDWDKAVIIYDEIRKYATDDNGDKIECVSCSSTKILVAPATRKNLFFALFPFFERRKYKCNQCKTVFNA